MTGETQPFGAQKLLMDEAGWGETVLSWVSYNSHGDVRVKYIGEMVKVKVKT
jgi:hypothetical protein